MVNSQDDDLPVFLTVVRLSCATPPATYMAPPLLYCHRCRHLLLRLLPLLLPPPPPWPLFLLLLLLLCVAATGIAASTAVAE